MASRALSCKFCPIVFFLVLVWGVQARKVFNVEMFGAVGNGKTDNTKAFSDAFRSACQYNGRSRILVPMGTFLVWSNVYKGPCKGPIDFKVKGNIKAHAGPVGLDHWFTFRYIDRLSITGGGTFDGQGHTAWPHNDCMKNSNCKSLPVSIRFDFVTNSLIRRITSLDSKNFHINIFECDNIRIERLRIIAPAESPNTDGIHVALSENIKIQNSTIATGDDCISLGPGSKKVEVLRVKCGPGHGISIGSLGKSHPYDVSGITVRNSRFDGTDNGLRIKTWAPSLKSKVHDIIFEDVIMNNVRNPILIEQQYCPSGNCDKSKASSVQIQDVWFKHIRGTSQSQAAVNLQCSSLYPCKNINLADINLSYKGLKGAANATCLNVQGSAWGVQRPNLEACV
ncbi:hypothetical protein CDL15_Pgr016007 [Punica granatum]|uniref:Exopolygalacturonase-like n=1 Tax=Punica granatum TaxID=22663 RepID=A0A218XR26_PUNGR|nr:hypothetical protein CDL15_Pgr016007 [Punica granatum]